MRPEGWEGQLASHISDANDSAFVWGQNDCVLWCADWRVSLGMDDLAADYRGTYATEDEAQAVLESMGFADTGALVSNYLPEIPVLMAQRGDIMLHPQGPLGICDGAYAYFLTQQGRTRIPFDKCTRAWKVD